jgi:hypothetical protein
MRSALIGYFINLGVLLLSLHVLAYNLKQMMSIVGIPALLACHAGIMASYRQIPL